LRSNYLLILACIAATFWSFTLDQQWVADNLVFSQDNLLAGRVWTLVTALFVHASPLHVFGNMLFLFVFGNTLEKMVGSKYYLMVFFIGGFTAFLLSMAFFPPDVGMLGASAAIFTLAACVMLMKPLKFSWLFLAPQGLVAIIYFIYNAVIVTNPSLIPGVDPNVAYIAHVIGFTVGIPFGIAWSERWKRNLVITLGLLGAYIAVLAAASALFGLQTSFLGL
jgi:rhomboid family protein